MSLVQLFLDLPPGDAIKVLALLPHGQEDTPPCPACGAVLKESLRLTFIFLGYRLTAHPQHQMIGNLPVVARLDSAHEWARLHALLSTWWPPLREPWLELCGLGCLEALRDRSR